MLLFADADITHDPRHLSALVARLHAAAGGYGLRDGAAELRILAGAVLVPAFVYFFQMLYPFAKVNDPLIRHAAAAGGTVLIRREALARIGGMERIKGALIDDVALATELKKFGPIYLGHSGLATSIRPYPQVADIWNMITRTAFTQLHYSGAGAGAARCWAWRWSGWCAPYEMLFGHGWRFRRSGWSPSCWRWSAICRPLARYRQSEILGAGAAVDRVVLHGGDHCLGAVHHWRGTGAKWKNRAYGADDHERMNDNIARGAAGGRGRAAGMSRPGPARIAGMRISLSAPG